MNNDTTYALLVRSEEKGRSIMETTVYALLGLSAILSILQFIQQPERLPTTLTTQRTKFQIPRRGANTERDLEARPLAAGR